MDGSPIEVTLAKPVDKDSYVRYTRGTGGRGGSLLQTDYTAYTLGQVRVLQETVLVTEYLMYKSVVIDSREEVTVVLLDFMICNVCVT